MIAACVARKISIADLSELRRKFLLTGGFPEPLILREDMNNEASALLQSQRVLGNDAVERAIYKDIPQAFGVDDPMLLERMLYALAGQFTGILDDEVDLVYDHPEVPLAFEIGSSDGHHHRGLKTFEARFPRFQGRCYYISPEGLAKQPSSTRDDIGTLPIDLFLLAVGGQMEQELAKRLTPGVARGRPAHVEIETTPAVSGPETRLEPDAHDDDPLPQV